MSRAATGAPSVLFSVHDRPKAVGGPYSWAAWLLPALRARGLDARALILQEPGVAVGAVTASLRAAGVPVTASPGHRYTEDAVRWLLTRIRADPPAVFVPNVSVPSYHAAPRLARAGIPSIGVLHSDDSFHRGLQDEFHCGPVDRRVSMMVAVSSYLAEEVAARSGGFARVRCIPYGVNVPPGQASRGNEPLRIAYVGRLVEAQKRVPEVARAFCRSVREVPGVEAFFYGDGPARGEVERICSVEGAGLPVHLAGRVDPERIQEHLLRSHVIVLLSDFEGLPIALLEAMACGCVPVCLRLRSGIPELVRDGETGILVNDRGDDLVRAIRQLAADPALWARLSQGARTLVQRGYSATRCADRWEELIREVAHPSSGAPSIRVPRWPRLPQVHPGLAHEDRRRTTVVQRVLRRARRTLGVAQVL